MEQTNLDREIKRRAKEPKIKPGTAVKAALLASGISAALGGGYSKYNDYRRAQEEEAERAKSKAPGWPRFELPNRLSLMPEIKTPDFKKIIEGWYRHEAGFEDKLTLVEDHLDGQGGLPGPEMISLLMGIARYETSGGDPDEMISSAGAAGTWQVMPRGETSAEKAADRQRLVKDERYCLDRAAKELKKHFERFNHHIALTLIAYNLGPRDISPRKGALEPRMQELFKQWLEENGLPPADLQSASAVELFNFAVDSDQYKKVLNYVVKVIASEKVIGEHLGPRRRLSYRGGELQLNPSRGTTVFKMAPSPTPEFPVQKFSAADSSQPSSGYKPDPTANARTVPRRSGRRGS